VVMTGSMDGVVRLWSVRYFQVPEVSTRNKEIADKGGPMVKKKSSEEDDSSILTAESPSEQDISNLDAPDNDPKQGVPEHLSAEVFDPDKDRDSMEDVHKAAKEPSSDSEPPTKAKENEEVPRKQESPHPPPVIRRHRNRAHSSGTDKDSSPGRNERDYEAKKAKRRSDIPISAIQSERDSEDGSPIGRNKHPPHSKPAMRIRGSKSENSLSFEGDENDSFEVVSEAEVARMRFEERKLSHGAAVMEAHKLRDGHVWERKLLFRGKLTSHTAYDRKDNTEPASITCITTSKDHKYVYVGDARGRIFSWSV